MMEDAEESTIIDKLRSGMLKIAGFFLPVVQTIPPLTIWGGLMTIPILSYLVLMFTSSPDQFLEALAVLFLGGAAPEAALAILGLALLVGSMVYLKVKKKSGLVITGVYKYSRHPQYLGAMLLTMSITSRSYWILTHTLGIGVLGPIETLLVWYAMVLAYVVLAAVEEIYLSKEFGNEYMSYRQFAPFLIPPLRFKNRLLEIVVSVIILILALHILIAING